jgi:hypothetical protein
MSYNIIIIKIAALIFLALLRPNLFEDRTTVVTTKTRKKKRLLRLLPLLHRLLLFLVVEVKIKILQILLFKKKLVTRLY